MCHLATGLAIGGIASFVSIFRVIILIFCLIILYRFLSPILSRWGSLIADRIFKKSKRGERK